MESVLLFRNFCNEHLHFVKYIASLDHVQFSESRNGKWSPAQQLMHLNLCLTPIAKALGAKTFLLQKFGVLQRAPFSYDEVIRKYESALENGGKAPEQFVPATDITFSREELMREMEMILSSIEVAGKGFTDSELNTIVMPHPLLGSLSVAEMLFLMTFHAKHHLSQTIRNLEYQAGYFLN